VRPGGGRRGKGPVVLVLGLVVAGLVILASAAGSVRPFDGSKNTWSRQPEPPERYGRPPELKSAIGWWDSLWTAILYVAIIVIALIVLRILYQVITADHPPRERKTDLAERHPVERFAEVVETGLAEIERGKPSDAVVACWVALEDAALAAGVAREISETAAEFTVRVLAVDGVSATDLLALADLYREARYSSHPSTEATRDQARAASLASAASSRSRRRDPGDLGVEVALLRHARGPRRSLDIRSPCRGQIT
jgi:hypothetical protein